MHSCLDLLMLCVVPQPFIMHRPRKPKQQFLARLPSDNIWKWFENQVVSRNVTVSSTSGERSIGTVGVRVQDQLSTSVTHFEDSSDRRVGSRERSDMPVVRTTNKGDPSKVRRIAMDQNMRMAAQRDLEDDMYALTRRSSSNLAEISHVVVWRR